MVWESSMMMMGWSNGAVLRAIVAAWISPMLFSVGIVPTCGGRMWAR